MTGIRLLPFQEVGRDHLAGSFHAALGDAPGLGKTLQAIAAVEKVGGEAFPVLVVCPASVRTHWARMIGPGHGARWAVASYTEVAAGGGVVHQNWGAVILDEAHFLKTLGAQRTQAVFGADGVARRTRYIWPLSGTFAPNYRPIELYPMLKALHPAFKDFTYARFAQRYCGAFWDGRQLNTKGATHTEELKQMMGSFLLARSKADAFPGRHEPILCPVPLELSAGDLRDVTEAEDEIGGREARLSPAAERYSQLGDTSRLLRLLGVAKVKSVCSFVDDLLVSQEKIVVFAYHTDVIHAIFEYYADKELRPVVYMGGMTDRMKQDAIEMFTSPTHGSRVFIGQRQAAGTGIDGLQTVCSTAVIAEPPWVPGESEQLVDRLDRMGQRGECVTAYFLYARSTLDEIVVRVCDRKNNVGRAMGMR